jgi:hypothetical protein
MVAINTDRLQDATLVLHDSASAVTGDALCTVGGQAAAGIIDLGGATSAGQIGATIGSAGTNAADCCFDVQVDLASAADVASTDEGYKIRILGSTSASFASAVALLGTLELGSTNATTGIGSSVGGLDTVKNTGTHILTVRNRINDTVYRYVRAIVECSGATPSITFGAYISKLHPA